MFRTTSRPLWQLAARASPRASLPRSSIAPLLRQQRAVYSSKSDQENPPPPKQPIDYEAERKRGEELLQSDPKHVSTSSSMANTTTAAQGSKSADEDMGSELKHDIGIVKDTFTFTDVPRESRILGLAGTLPYLGTSLSTVFLAWDLNKAIPTGNAFYDAIMVDHETAKHYLSLLEPLQLGYGAVIISFLGAIHWGLEYAEKQPLHERTRFRYGMGLAASVVAWPTVMLPVEYALTTQFMAFVALYFADSRAATKGWAPRWYGAYRFLLTAMVGLAIFISLIGRAKIKQGDAITAKGLSDNFARSGIADHETNWEKLEEEEKQRRRKKEAEEEKKRKEEEKKKKEEEKKKGKKGGDKEKKSDDKEKKGDDKEKKGDDKAKASEEKSDKKEEKSENKDEGKKSESKDKESESKEDDKKAESKDEGKDEKPKEESSDKKEGDSEKKDSEQKSGKEEKKDDSKDKKDDKSDDKKDDKSDDKKDDKSDDKKDDKSEKKDDKSEKKDDKSEKKDDKSEKKDDKSEKKDDKSEKKDDSKDESKDKKEDKE